ncbi:hypothetical protein BAE44_0000195 [Dichanthelium oligosanthes]|uniref:Uncharacterized protein n=1 Tax=Dichanthelium oligosanthes TaxID=888268 RepID=A0A1E5WN46_9POAL|nr:hypothetical protein BAE44_0000195 [Dichanthelium oligosanthes]
METSLSILCMTSPSACFHKPSFLTCSSDSRLVYSTLDLLPEALDPPFFALWLASLPTGLFSG